MRSLQVGLLRANAWDLLQERDEDGTARGPLPYTEEAIKAFEKLHDADPNNTDIIHHLAIAHHAMAWDMELGGSSDNAAREWETALAYWQELAASSVFWEGMKKKLKLCQPDADPAPLDQLRNSLVEELLHIHVDFIRHHCELANPDRAETHVRIVQRANIKPALKKKLIHRVYEAMTASVLLAQAQKDYESGLVCVERFLKLYSDTTYLPALRAHTELCKSWMERLSYQNEWNVIMSLVTRAEPIVMRLVDALKSEKDPSAISALEDLTFEITLRGWDKSQTMQTMAGNDEEQWLIDRIKVHEFTTKWGRIGASSARDGSRIKDLFPSVLNAHALALHDKFGMLIKKASRLQSPLSAFRKTAGICREEIVLLEEALKWNPNATVIKKNLKVFREELAQVSA